MRFRARVAAAASSGVGRGWRCVLGIGLVAACALVWVPSVDATIGVDDYPHRLKSAAQDSLVDPWLFYNRECTSFVAWRLNNDGGIPFDNYYLGVHWGDASNWAHAAAVAGLTVNDSPTEGAVAWWRAGSAGSSRGHVAWVESASASSITIEEYNYLHEGGYDTRTISSSSSLWPSGFIHIRDITLRNTARPTITGTPQVGDFLGTSRGSWTPGGAEFTYQWLADGTKISGATRKTLRLTAALLRARIQVEVTATKAGLTPVTVTSGRSAPVAPGAFAVEQLPIISGGAQVGVTMSATTGTWSPTGTYTYQWYAGDTAVAGATHATFTPTAAELNEPITVQVTAKRTGYRTAVSTSDQTALVAPGTFVNTAPPTISGTAQVGVPLTAAPGDWSPTADYDYQWFADGTPIARATASAYTPVAADVHRQLTVQVTATRVGYDPGILMSSPTAKVARGTFVTSRAPAITGTPQVGVPMSADPGAWSPKALFTYQWYAGNDPVPGATGPTFTPTAAEFGKPMAVQVTATRAGYVTGVAQSAATAAVAAGHIENVGRPGVTGKPRVGARLTAAAGSWSVQPTSITYQWLVDGTPIDGATHRTYVPTSAQGAHSVSVRVTVTTDGYAPASRTSKAVYVLLGSASFAHPPRIHGRPVVGGLLTADPGTVTPSDAHIAYRWYRGKVAIHGATDATYTPTRRDAGHRLSVRVTLTAPDWAPASSRSERTDVVRQPG